MAWLNYLLALQLRISIKIDPTAILKILMRNLEKILKIKTQKLVFIVQKTQRAKEPKFTSENHLVLRTTWFFWAAKL